MDNKNQLNNIDLSVIGRKNVRFILIPREYAVQIFHNIESFAMGLKNFQLYLSCYEMTIDTYGSIIYPIMTTKLTPVVSHNFKFTGSNHPIPLTLKDTINKSIKITKMEGCFIEIPTIEKRYLSIYPHDIDYFIDVVKVYLQTLINESLIKEDVNVDNASLIHLFCKRYPEYTEELVREVIHKWVYNNTFTMMMANECNVLYLPKSQIQSNQIASNDMKTTRAYSIPLSTNCALILPLELDKLDCPIIDSNDLIETQLGEFLKPWIIDSWVTGLAIAETNGVQNPPIHELLSRAMFDIYNYLVQLLN